MRLLRAMLAMVVLCGAGRAQTPAAGGTTAPAEAAPAGATARCNDGSYSKARQKWQACGGHKGVQTWFAAGADPAGADPKPATSGAAAPAVAASGNDGKVWVNRATRVYHCPGTKFYGKTKNGEYMSEADAKKAGARPDRNRPCS